MDQASVRHRARREPGRAPREKPKYDGLEERLLVLHPHPSGVERVLEYPKRADRRHAEGALRLRRQGARRRVARFKMLPDGQAVFEEKVSGRGLPIKEIGTPALAGHEVKVAFAVASPKLSWCLLGVGRAP
ncbi:MAG: hypothetical protein ACOX6T_19765 [Myxococcales bacterium]|jgi:hypothetical protein